MSQKGKESKSIGKESKLMVTGKDEAGNFLVKDKETGNICTIVNTFAEM